MSQPLRERVHYLEATDDCMAPLVADGTVVAVTPDRTPVAGDLVVVAARSGRRDVRLLVADDLDHWLVAIRGAAPVVLVPPLAVVGVVAEVLEDL